MVSADLKSCSDEELIELFRDGRGAAFRELIGRYQRPLLNHLDRLLGSKTDAEDAFQETFTRVYRALSRFESDRRFKPWLYSIAGNLVKNTYRSRSTRKIVSLNRALKSETNHGESLLDVLEASQLGPLELLEKHERATIVRKLVSELPIKGRQALVMFYFEGASYKEISQCAKVPLGTVKSRIHNATAQLLKKMSSLAASLAPER